MKHKTQKGFTLIELMVVIVIIGILVAIALPNFIGAQDRARMASIKSNMHSFQVVIETYGIDWGGGYPNTYASIQSEALSKDYAKDYTNPINGQVVSLNNATHCTRLAEVITGAYDPVSYTDNTVYGGPGGAGCAGQVIYRRAIQSSQTFAIYGLDKNGIWIEDKGRIIELSNS